MAPLGGAPRLVLLFSGKRKSGKDFVTEALRHRWGGGRGRALWRRGLGVQAGQGGEVAFTGRYGD